MKSMFSFDQESAKNAGSGGVYETGCYVCEITSATWTKGGNTESEALLLNAESDSGSKFNFLRLTYIGKEGKEVKHGAALINAIMGILGIKNLSCVETRLMSQQTGELEIAYQCPEFIGKNIGLVLQKVLTSKTDGSDSFRFEIRQVYVAAGNNAQKTYKEALEKLPAESVDKLLLTLKDKDERTNNSSHNSYSGAALQDTVRPSRLQQQSNHSNNTLINPDTDDNFPF